jgi:soluble lytic murein transglycosylase-like protein
MAPVRAAFAALVLLAATPANGDAVDRWQPQIEEAAARFGIPTEWIERVMRAESGGQPISNGHPIVSSAGAMGLMQLMPGTWAEMRTRLSLGSDPYNPRDNILAGTAYLRLMYDRFGYPGLFGAYNAGPERYAAYLAGASALPRETRVYLAQTVRSRATAKGGPTASPRPLPNGIFFMLGENPVRDKHRVDENVGLFVALDGDAPGE